jgi:NADPH:quinone reductase-like Zn-dependent oxidoreductase
MKAIVQNDYGSSNVLELKEIDIPVVKEKDVLVSVHAAAVNAGDYFSMIGSPWAVRMFVGFPKPKNYILGWDVAGRVKAVGKKVTQFQPGDGVFGSCNRTFAEYVSADADEFAMKPTNLTFEQASAVPTAAITALQGLRDTGHVQTGQKVLINGASGGVGTFAVQIAKSFGAEVTGVCSTKNVDMVLSIGADHVIDYTKKNFTQGGQRYDLILDNVANRSFSELRRLLTPKGIIIPNSGHGGMNYVIKGFVLSAFMRRQGRPFVAKPNNRDLVILKELIELGKITPVIDKTYSLKDTPKAIEYVGRGHTQGKVVVTLEHNKKI